MDETTETVYDMKKHSPGSFAPSMIGGATVDNFTDMLYARSGVPASHSLRAALATRHGSYAGPAQRLPDVFPPADFAGKLDSTQDWLDLVASVDTSERTSSAPVTAMTPQVPDPAALPAQPSVAVPQMEATAKVPAEPPALEGAIAVNHIFNSDM
jgi:hypothetical protein